MYSNKLVACLKSQGKVLREFKDTVRVPFNTEFSILLKNLHDQRALVNIYIDGENHTPSGLVINAKQEFELERSIANGSLTQGNKFKFIERTDAVEEHRGIKLEDGIVRIEFQYEKPYVAPVDPYVELWKDYKPYTPKWPPYVKTSPNIMRSYFNSGITETSYSTSMNIGSSNAANSILRSNSFVNDSGITVPGEHSSQSFSTTTMRELELEKNSIILKIVGATPDNKPVEKPITVQRKVICNTCGRHNKQTSNFCATCGTSLQLYA